MRAGLRLPQTELVAASSVDEPPEEVSPMVTQSHKSSEGVALPRKGMLGRTTSVIPGYKPR
jgi:hypothetical protein